MVCELQAGRHKLEETYRCPISSTRVGFDSHDALCGFVWFVSHFGFVYSAKQSCRTVCFIVGDGLMNQASCKDAEIRLADSPFQALHSLSIFFLQGLPSSTVASYRQWHTRVAFLCLRHVSVNHSAR